MERGGTRKSRGPPALRSVAVLVAWAVLASSLGVAVLGSPRARAAPPPSDVRIGEVALTISTFNPLAITLSDDYVVAYNVYSTLLTFNETYAPVADLASSSSLAADQVTWTLRLVPNAYFVDPADPSSLGHPVTADDVVFTYNLVMNQTASVLHPYVSELVSVAKLDAYTVRMVTRQPYAAMYSTLANVPILPEYLWSSIANPVAYRPPYPIGSGPMYYDAANSSLPSFYVLRRSPSYYGPADYGRRIQPEDVRFISYSAPSTMVNDFLSGASSLDAVEGIDAPNYLASLGGWAPKWGVDEGNVGEFTINVMTATERDGLEAGGLTQNSGGANSHIMATNGTVRRAIGMSINRTALIRDALRGLGSVGDTLVPDTNPWHYPEPLARQYPFGPAAARTMLNAAGWKYDGNGVLDPGATPLYQAGATQPLLFRFFIPSGTQYASAAADIVRWLNETGIVTTDASGDTVPGYAVTSLSSAWLAANYDLLLWNWIFPPGSDPSVDILSVETTMAIGPTSDNFYSNATYDALYNESLVTMDAGARRNLTNTMQDMIYQYASYILPYYQYDLFAALSPSSPTLGSAARWANWGNWTRDPGLTPSSGLPNLWFQLQPVAADTTPPVTSASLSGTQGANGWYDSTVRVTLTATDDLTGVASTVYSMDGGPWQTYSVPFTLSANGNHTVAFHSVDGAGNMEADHTLSVEIDTAPPVLTNLAPSGTLTASSVVFRWTGSDAVSGITDYAVRIDGGAFRDLGLNESVTLALSDGTHVITVRATDAAGNTAVESTTVTVNTGGLGLPGSSFVFLVVAILVVVGVSLLAILWFRRRRKPSAARPGAPPPPPPP